MIGSGQEMISLIKSKGSCQYMTYNGATVDVRCYSAYLQKKFYFLFENNTGFVYDATYTFQMTNLCIERGDGTDSFRIRLRPGQTCLRSLAPIDPAAKSTAYPLLFRVLFQCRGGHGIDVDYILLRGMDRAVLLE